MNLVKLKVAKNSSRENVNSKDGIENDGARTGENAKSSTFRDKFKTKLKLVSMNLLSSVRMLVLKLWKASKRVFLWL